MKNVIRLLVGGLLLSTTLNVTAVKAAEDSFANNVENQVTIDTKSIQSTSSETEKNQTSKDELLFSTDSTEKNTKTDESVESTETSTTENYSETDSDLQAYLQQTDDLFPLQESRSDLNGAAGRRKLRSYGRSAFSIPTINAGESGRPRFDFIDVSSWNSDLKVSDYVKIKNYGVRSVVVKLTEATSYKNPYAADQIKNAQAAGLKVHVYHYSWFTSVSQARREAEYFAAFAKNLQLTSNTLMVNDIEEPQIVNSGDHTKNSLAFAQRLSELGFKNTMHYIGRHWVDTGKIDTQKLGLDNCWIAQYPYNPTNHWNTEFSAWQWTSQVVFPGVNGVFDMSADYKGKFIGTPQGEAIKDQRYVTISNKNYSIWQNFSWKKRSNSATYLNKTLEVRYRYDHVNGSSYYSLYDNNGKWVGYLNKNATTNGAGGQFGKIYSTNSYVKINSNANLYTNKNLNKPKNITAEIKKQVYVAKYYYNAFNGRRYESLYDINGKWLGYVANDELTKQANQGPARAFHQYVSISSKNYNFWQNFSWKKRDASSNYYHQTLNAKYIYEHTNGSSYLSLYDKNNKWLGYVNKNGTKITGKQGIALSYNKSVKIKRKNYSIWQNFSWKEKNKSNNYLNQTLIAKYQYKHFNGATYYSLYSHSGVWLGYINANATK
ncbi:hypothetical protein IGI65_001430 [Enterococcus sp. DIV0755b]|uniref:GH25 family lysozyme n=1 Tax=Enterococcus sp. DIV0755b TaxID=2774657 RepID=UPI003F1EA5F4